MSYVTELKKSAFLNHVAEGLRDHLSGEELADASVKFEEIIPTLESNPRGPRKVFSPNPKDVRMPSRLSNPMIPYPLSIRAFLRGVDEEMCEKVHDHHCAQLRELRQVLQSLEKTKQIPKLEKSFDMNSLKKYARQSYSSREDLITQATLSFAERATKHDLSIAAMAPVDFKVSPSMISQYASFIIMIQRLRVHIAKDDVDYVFKEENVHEIPEEAAYTMFSNGVYWYRAKDHQRSFGILSCGGHFAIYHSNLPTMFHGPSSYLDYLFTMADTINNIDVLKNCKEYEWATEFFHVLIDFTEHEGNHNHQVDYMKAMEGFLLNMSDYDEDFAMNWKPLMDAAYELWSLDKKISRIDYDFGLIPALLTKKSFLSPKGSYLCRMINAANKVSRTHMQELSALHKFVFYAEVDGQAGVKKFLARVHTKRKINNSAVKNLVRHAKCLFTVAYRKRHNMMPNIIGPPEKIKLLESYCSRGQYTLIESLNLNWWDDIRLFDCMDNTLTDDPLEFAKDKGALKPEISFGPGDSRKELLQVIEKESHPLPDFFKDRNLKPKPRKIVRTNRLQTAISMRDAARLIEKEREQKIAARLFGNAGLENKHALSLVATKMKKALSYFDEQLMTPSDKKRKYLIHEAARELSQKDNYSLLLDIEGHNQSMQYENTTELCEFIGNLFGYDTWGELPHYFSSLTVYHYDEYEDDVLISEGQYGGIEGWLNPLWTLHTTLMLKLLRIMTDVDIKTIMVYSDDVNAIVKIRQASESMVKSIFSKIMDHCTKFGMTVKYSQTTLSKHRITMLRQHYADGIRADSSLKRLISVSAANNPMIISDEIEVAGICSSASSALELSNHQEACSYLKNYKIGLLISRLPQMILSRPDEGSMISKDQLPDKLSRLLFYMKDDKTHILKEDSGEITAAVRNDVLAYIGRTSKEVNMSVLEDVLSSVYAVPVAESRFVDNPDRLLYLQLYDDFLKDLMFFWTYMPCNLGGLGGSLHINLVLSGHSVGFTKSLHYMMQWMKNYSSNSEYFQRYLMILLSVKEDDPRNMSEVRLANSNWQNDTRLCSATTSIKQSIKSMVRRKTKNKSVLQLFELSDKTEGLAMDYVEIFRHNFHPRICQFYHENTSCHFIDLLLNKVETSSGLLVNVRNLRKLRKGLAFRTIENIRIASTMNRTIYGAINNDTDIVEYLFNRKKLMYPNISFIEVEEILYDDRIEEVDYSAALITVRRCSPTHYRNGIQVYDDAKVGNETLYKGELIDDDRMLGNKEELLAARVVAVTKWFLVKFNMLSLEKSLRDNFDIIKACDLSLQTLTGQTFEQLYFYAPTETGGEILHRIPNARFSTMTYIRTEMNRSLKYTTELNQSIVTRSGMVDSNVNFDYLRMRLLMAAIIRDKYDNLRRFLQRFSFNRMSGIVDVQFVSPKSTEYSVETKYTCYAALRNHEMSLMRFRYLSYSYLYTEEITEWATMPKVAELRSAEVLGNEYINDIILRYSRELDKDYMLISREIIDDSMWKPLIIKLRGISQSWKEMTDEDCHDQIRDRLAKTLISRSRITLLDKSNPVHVALQTMCLERIMDASPEDTEYELLSKQFTIIMQNKRHSQRLMARLSRYQRLLADYNRHKENLARSLILEYIVTFHFKISHTRLTASIDVKGSVDEFMANPIGRLSQMILSPALQTRLLVLGIEFVEQISTRYKHEIYEELRELCEDVSLEDIILPTKLPSIDSYTTLTGFEELPEGISSIEYASEKIAYTAMESLHEIAPLCHYAQKCCIAGAMVETFSSHTGSDSLGAQYGLLSHLKYQNIIDEDMTICDLTAGRGDGQYALGYLGLKGDSYSLDDMFTKINHHPSIIVRPEYDVFNGATLKFITAYDFIHIDLSFTGETDINILDLVLFLENNSLPYSIRLNSVILEGYDRKLHPHLPEYSHSIAYASNSRLKPYQIYLVGIPSSSANPDNYISTKETIAFKSIALAYSHLLSPQRYYDVSDNRLPNSVTINIPQGAKQDDYIIKCCTNSVVQEQSYYVERFLTEVGQEHYFSISPNHMPPGFVDTIATTRARYTKHYHTIQVDNAESLIGNVSQKSYPYHLRHLSSLADPSLEKWQFSVIGLDEDTLHYFRTHHPLQEVRSWCNICLGLVKFCSQEYYSGLPALQDLHKTMKSSQTPKLSMHQRELQSAIKLHVIAASNNDRVYGIRYIHTLLANSPRESRSLMRILRSHRLTGYLFNVCRRLYRSGVLTVKMISSIRNEYEVREPEKYKYKRRTEMRTYDETDYSDIRKMIEGSTEDLFTNLNNYALAMVNSNADQLESTEEVAPENNIDLHFDIGLTEQIEMMIKKLGLEPSGPHGIIDIGDADIYVDEDWD